MDNKIKFSIIVPVYNVEQYLSKCINSILEQTYDNFEILVVNDGSPDNSQAIIDEFVAKYPEKIKAFVKENGGLSDARNYGIDRAKGDYLIFVDSDDYLGKDMLEKLAQEANANAPDVIGINLTQVDINGNVTNIMTKPVISCLDGQNAIKALLNHKQCFDPACGFVYKREFWNEKGFEFMVGIYHEDFALIPIVVFSAKTVSNIDYGGYFYVYNDTSITKGLNPEKIKKMANDMLKGYDFLIKEYEKVPEKDSYCSRLFLHYITSSLIFRLENLQDKQFKKEFRAELKKRKIADNIMDDNFKRKIRKFLIRFKNRL